MSTSIQEANEIIKREGWDAGSKHLDPQDVLDTLNEKYPEQKNVIVSAMMMQVLERMSSGGGAMEARREMTKQFTRACASIEAHNDGYEKIGRSPVINDGSSYEGVSKEESEKMVIEDFALGLRLYNACAEYVRNYNTAKVDES